jgi:hypothetical protein
MLAVVTLVPSTPSKWSDLDALASCHGAQYVESESYSAQASSWGHLPRGGWRGAVLGPDGTKIYGIPTNASHVLEIDPATRTVSTFGSLGGPQLTDSECSGTVHCGVEKWIGGVLAPNGKVIGIPYSAETVLEIDPTTRTVQTFGVM